MGTCCAEIHMMKLRKKLWFQRKQLFQERDSKKRRIVCRIYEYEYEYDIRYTIRGDSFFANLVRLISDEPNKIQGCSTTGFGDNDLNCVVG